MPLFAETEEKIFGDILIDVAESTNISRTSPGSKMLALAQAVSRKMGRMYSIFDLNISQAFLDGAEGQYLNFFGDMLGVSRLGEEPASVGSQDRNLRFYVDIGTFGDINSGSSILIPAGTIISTGPNGTGILYRVVANTILLASDSEGYIAVQSVRTGSDINVGANQLIYHDFVNYTDSANESLQVTNDAEIITGQDIEIDSNYRFRIANQVLAVERANLTAIRLAALNVPGVADVVLVPFHRGIGTYDLMIKSTTPRIADSLIATVKDTIDAVSSQGIVSKARGPEEIGISLVGTVTFKRALSEEEESSILQVATDNVIDYINTLDIGEEFVVNEVIERVMSSSELIRSLGTPTKPLDNLYLYRPSKLEDNRVRSSLIDDYTPEVDERVIVEDRVAGNTPILFRAA